MSYIVKVYADAIISGKRLFSSVPAKLKADVQTELQNRVAIGIISESELIDLLKK